MMKKFLFPVLVVFFSAAVAPAWNDGKIDLSIEKAAVFLSKNINQEGRVPCRCSRQAGGGAEALTAVALLEAGHAKNNPKFDLLLSYLDKISPGSTYVRAMRATAYSSLGEKYQASLKKDIEWLVKHQTENGGWGIEAADLSGNTHDTFLAAMAIDSSRGSLTVDYRTWKRIWNFVNGTLNPDGGFGYTPRWRKPFRFRGGSNILSTLEMISTIKTIQKHTGDKSEKNNLIYLKAHKWLEKNRDLNHWQRGPLPRYQYCFMMTATSSICHPWFLYREIIDKKLGRYLSGSQAGDGSWEEIPYHEDRIVASARALRTLAAVRTPVLVNKLAPGCHTFHFNNVANLCSWIHHCYERGVGWQILTADMQEDRLRMAPILYLSGKGTQKYLESSTDKFREHLAGRGNVIIQPLPKDRDFYNSVTGYFKQYFGDFKRISTSHPVMKTPYQVSGIDLAAITIDGKPRIFLFNDESFDKWRMFPDDKTLPAYRCFENIVHFTTGNQWPDGKFSITSRKKSGDTKIKSSNYIEFVRITQGKKWPEFEIVARALSLEMTRSFGIGVKQKNVELGDLIPRNSAMAWISGSSFGEFDERQTNRIKEFCRNGGIILVDSLSDQEDFSEIARKLIGRIFNTRPQPIAVDHPLITGDFAEGLGSNIQKCTFNRNAAKTCGSKTGPPALTGVTWKNRIVALITHRSIAGSIAGQAELLQGYQKESAMRIALNLILYSTARKEKAMK